MLRLNHLQPFEKMVQDAWLREEIYHLASENYRNTQDLLNYKSYYQLHSTLYDSMNLVKDNARILFINKMSQKQDEILQSDAKKHKIWIYSLSGTILLVWVISFFLNRNLNLKQKNQERILRESKERERLEAEIKAQESAGKIVIPDKTVALILKKLNDFEKKQTYLDASMSLNLLAEKLKTNTKYLSEIINTHKNKNFHTYINELRIKYIIYKLQTEPIYLKYKVSHLAEEAGFSSHSLFSSVFKQVTGLTPASYIKLITKEKSNEGS